MGCLLLPENGEELCGCHMNDAVIKVENLSKKYLIGHQRKERYTVLRDVMTEGAKNFARKLLHPFNDSTNQQFNDSTEEFYALRDVSFEINRGDRVGIIGRNGAGKSTLLKILSRITDPTSGRIEITGRVASLLEVGTGFHPELTGRENIYLNGAILGMGKAEIKLKFDEIVAFAEVEKFLDTPVKRYSSGMYVRLAFAVAAHLEPEILIVDEVLAVGDAQFQKKCLGKMEDIGKEGRTVLFVSHNMVVVQALCQQTIILMDGSVKYIGDTASAIYQYLELSNNINISAFNADEVAILSLQATSDDNRQTFYSDSAITIQADFVSSKILPNTYVNFVIKDEKGQFIWHTRNDLAGLENFEFQPGTYRIEVRIPRLSIRSGVYSLFCSIYVNSFDVTEHITSDPVMFVVDGPQEGGIVQTPCTWSCRGINNE